MKARIIVSTFHGPDRPRLVNQLMTRRGAADLLRACRRVQDRQYYRIARRGDVIQIFPRAGFQGALIDLVKEV